MDPQNRFFSLRVTVSVTARIAADNRRHRRGHYRGYCQLLRTLPFATVIAVASREHSLEVPWTWPWVWPWTLPWTFVATSAAASHGAVIRGVDRGQPRHAVALAAEHDGNGKRETHDDGQTRTEVWRDTQHRTGARRICGGKREENSSSSPAQHSREDPPGLAMVAATSTSSPCPTELGGDWCRAFGGGRVIVVWGRWGVYENWLATCRVKDQLQPKSPPRRVYNAACCGIERFWFI